VIRASQAHQGMFAIESAMDIAGDETDGFEIERKGASGE
jgi:hypothetical protein